MESLNEIMDALEEVDDTDRASVKALERQKRQIEERLEKLLSSQKDSSLCFEKLGFDYLAFNERREKIRAVKRGLTSKSSIKDIDRYTQMCFDAL